MATKKAINKKVNKSSHITKGDVLDDLGFSSEITAALKLKADLYDKIMAIVEKEKHTQRELEKILDKPQPRISELLNGKIAKLSIEKLLEYLGKLGGEVTINVKMKRAA